MRYSQCRRLDPCGILRLGLIYNLESDVCWKMGYSQFRRLDHCDILRLCRRYAVSCWFNGSCRPLFAKSPNPMNAPAQDKRTSKPDSHDQAAQDRRHQPDSQPHLNQHKTSDASPRITPAETQGTRSDSQRPPCPRGRVFEGFDVAEPKPEEADCAKTRGNEKEVWTGRLPVVDCQC